jgi:prephenate dehydrogenase
MKPPEVVAILGVGLIGGSIGLALRERGFNGRIIGIGRHRSRLRKALRLGAITESTTSIEKGVSQADLIFVCTPVDCIAQYAQQISQHAPSGAVITDVGSTKGSIVAALTGKTGDVHFVGSHPLAGNEKPGVEYAVSDLFANRTVVITPDRKTNEVAKKRIIKFWKDIGAVVVSMSTKEHDRSVAMISHMPHAVAAVLASTPTAGQLKLAATGFADTTRIAAADVELWVQIIRDNSFEVLQSLEIFIDNLEQVRGALEQSDYRKLRRYLKRGKQARGSLGS